MQSQVPEIAAYSGAIITFVSWLIKKLIDHYFAQSKRLKEVEADLLNQRINASITKLEYDINGLGSKLRLFEQKNESLSGSIGKFDVQIDRLSSKLETLQKDISDFVYSFDKKVREIIILEQQ